MGDFVQRVYDKLRGRKATNLPWLDICRDLDKTKRIDELRQFVFTNVTTENLPKVAKYFDNYKGSTSDLTAFHIHILSLKKRDLCIALAKYFEGQAWA